MPFLPFYKLYPEIAINETRSIILPSPTHGLPAGEYAFIETYCDDPDCDCRRVIFTVMKKGRDSPIAGIGWGWEPLEFYAKWMSHDPTPEEVKNCKGPALNPLSEQSELAYGALELCRDVLIQDPAYVERVKGHYRLFRAHIDGTYKPGKQASILANAERKRQMAARKARKAQKEARRKNRR